MGQEDDGKPGGNGKPDEDGKPDSPKGMPDLFEDIEAAPHPDAPALSDEPPTPTTEEDIVPDAPVGISGVDDSDSEAPKLAFPDADDQAALADATPPGMPPLEDLLQPEPEPEPEPEKTPEPGAGRQRFAFADDDDIEALERGDESGIEARTMVIVGGVVVLIFVILLGYLYFAGGETPSDQDVPLVKAPEGPAKIEPEDRGGMEVADQDKLVFDRATGEETPLQENMTAGPEEPQALPEPDVLQEKDTAAAANVPDTTDTPNTTDTIDRVAAVLAEETPAVAPTPKPTQRTTEPAQAIAGGYLVQLGAYGSRESALSDWRNISARFSDIIGGAREQIEAAELGARGTLYRLRAGPYPTKSEAVVTCSALKAAGRDCLVVKR